MASLIDAGTLADLQQMSEDTMPDTVTIERYAPPTASEGGGQVYGPPTTETTVGRLNTASQTQGDLEAERYGQVAQGDSSLLTVPMGTTVLGTDTIRVLSARTGVETRYTVEEVIPLGSFSVDRKIVVKPVRP